MGALSVVLLFLVIGMATASAEEESPVGEGEVVENEGAEAEGAEQEQEEEEEAAEPQGPDPKIYVLAADSLRGEVSEIVTERINQTVRGRLESLGGIELLPTFQAMRQAQEESSHAAISRAERDYTSGIGLVNAEQYEQAAEVLQGAVDSLREHVADLHNFNILTDAMLNLGIAYAQTGFDLDARDNIRQFAQLRPDASPDLSDYPSVESLFTNEVERVRNAGEGTLQITANRPGAQVYLNGDLKGEAPLELEGVGFGEHFLVLRAGDWLWSETVRVRARGQEQEVDVELRHSDELERQREEMPSFYVDLRENLRSGQFGREMQPYFQELANQTGADYVAWVLVLPDGRDYAAAPFIYRTEDGMVVQGENVVFNQELSNLRSRSNQLSDVVATSVVFMPDSMAVDTVDLVVEEEEPQVAEEPRDEVARTDDDQARDELPVPGPTTTARPDSGQINDRGLQEFPDDEGRSTWTYVGWGGAAAVVAGAVAGTVFLLTRSDGPAGLQAEVEW